MIIGQRRHERSELVRKTLKIWSQNSGAVVATQCGLSSVRQGTLTVVCFVEHPNATVVGGELIARQPHATAYGLLDHALCFVYHARSRCIGCEVDPRSSFTSRYQRYGTIPCLNVQTDCQMGRNHTCKMEFNCTSNCIRKKDVPLLFYGRSLESLRSEYLWVIGSLKCPGFAHNRCILTTSELLSPKVTTAPLAVD